MSFIERAFTMPGTGGREAAEIQARAKAAAPPPEVPKATAAPPPPPPFSSPGSKRLAAGTATTMLGAAALGGRDVGGQTRTGGEQARKSVLGA
jgi:hypothetical protein